MNDTLKYCEFSSDIEFSELLYELLSILPYETCVTDDLETHTTLCRVYYENDNDIEILLERLKKEKESWKEFGVICSDIIPGSLKNEDWTQVWKKYFKIQHITDNIVIKASWLDYERKGSEKIIEIDPGMSFGTGSHETTQFCLAAIETLSKMPYKSLLDAGCGSGILAIAASMFGFAPIYAFDYDKESVVSTIENFKRNSVNDNINLQEADIALYSPDIKFDVVIANIISGTLIENVDRLLSWLNDDGCLVVAGILKNEYPKVREAFSIDGFEEIYNSTQKEWTGGIFHRGAAKKIKALFEAH